MVKNTSRFLLIIIIAWLWLPTSPIDIGMIWGIATFGVQTYIMISIGLVIFLYLTIEGRTVKDKWNSITREVKGVFG